METIRDVVRSAAVAVQATGGPAPAAGQAAAQEQPVPWEEMFASITTAFDRTMVQLEEVRGVAVSTQKRVAAARASLALAEADAQDSRDNIVGTIGAGISITQQFIGILQVHSDDLTAARDSLAGEG